jgi:hypothetical protein
MMRSAYCATAALMLLAMRVQPAVSPVEATQNAAQRAAWDVIKRWPDWSGSWRPVFELQNQFSVRPPLTPAWQLKLEKLRAADAKGEYIPGRIAQCIPAGLPLEMTGPGVLLEFLFSPQRITITNIAGWVRRIYLAQPLPDDPDPSFQGSSIGHWEGATLVVQTIGLDPKDEMLYGLRVGDDARLTERIYLTDRDTMRIDSQLEAAQALSGPYRFSHEYKRTTEAMLELDCAQNNRDFVNPVTGQPEVDLRPPE